MVEQSTSAKWWRSVRNAGLVIAVCGMPVSTVIGQSNFGSEQPDSSLEDELLGSTSADGMQELDGDINVSSFLTVDLHVQDTDLANVLKMLSMQSQKNIIVSKNVAATVTADLYDVTFYEALDAILAANGYGYREDGNFIYVYTRDELQGIIDSERQTVHQRFELSYLNAADAAVFVTPLLSDDGTIAINGAVGPGIDPDTGDVGGPSWAYSATMVVSDFPENIEAIGKMIVELDTRPQQVLVEATVLQTKLTEDNAWGMDISLVADMDFVDLANPLSGVNELINGSFQPDDNKGFGGVSSVGNTGGPGGLKIGVVSEDISVFMRVLDDVTDTTVLSRPKVLTLNRQRGEILIGAQIGYLSTTATETSTTQTVEFLDTGTKLLFRPFIARDGFIRLELAPSVSEGLIREVTTSGGDAVTIPDRITQELTTNVVVRSGSTVLLGGLFREQTDLGRSSVPILGDMPLIGPAFQGRTDTTERQEIMFLITPTIMKDEYLDAMGQQSVDGIRHARLAARKGVLPWSNDRLTAQHNLAAEEAIRQGDMEQALWEIEKSLSLKPSQPEVLRLKEEVTGKQGRMFDRELINSLMEESIDELIGRQETNANNEVDLTSILSLPAQPEHVIGIDEVEIANEAVATSEVQLDEIEFVMDPQFGFDEIAWSETEDGGVIAGELPAFEFGPSAPLESDDDPELAMHNTSMTFGFDFDPQPVSIASTWKRFQQFLNKAELDSSLAEAHSEELEGLE